MRLYLFRDEEGEARLWSHGINESARKRPGAWPLHYRWWLHFVSWCFGVEWVVGRSANPMLLLKVGEGDGPEINLWIGIPFLLSLYLTLEWPRLERIVPTVRSKSYAREGEYWDMPITRCLGFKIHDGRIWFSLWADEMDSGHNKSWQEFNLGPVNFLLGRMKYSQYGEQAHEVEIVMPEGRYPAVITTYTAVWKRARWPFAKRVYKADIEVEGGIPVPGKGDNSWDMDDDAIYSMSCSARTADEAAWKMFESVMGDRVRYARADWSPAGGWPGHLVRA